MEFKHLPVLLNECIDGLNISKGGVYIDGTLGGAGHSLEICRKLSGTGALIGIDQDINAINAAKERLSDFNNVIYIHDNFSNIKNFIYTLRSQACSDSTKDRLLKGGEYEDFPGKPYIDGVLLDLGVSSHQLDEAERGFSYNFDAPLDMRMDVRNSFSASDVVNQYDEDKLFKIISTYGEERWAKRIAGFIAEERKKKPIHTTFELVSVIKKAVPKGARTDGPHPAKRTFQAIRIEVNSELEILERSISDLFDCMNKGGRLCIITFHSLEDRIVKNKFRNLENPCKCPPDFPVCACGKTGTAKIITRRPVAPSEEETLENNRARSAKLRVLEKL